MARVAFIALLAVVAAGHRTRWRRCLLTFGILSLLVNCGGSTAHGRTPRGSYTIVVSATSKNSLKTPITMQLLNVPADTALELIAEEAGLGVVRKGNTFRINSNPGA